MKTKRTKLPETQWRKPDKKIKRELIHEINPILNDLTFTTRLRFRQNFTEPITPYHETKCPKPNK